MKSTLQKPDYQNPKNVYHIGGIPVEFPYQPYGTQLAFMGRVISTLDRAQREGHCHALLESPTGTGKSLSLLCSALAWQMHRGSKGVRSNGSQSRADPRAALDPLNHGGGFVPESQPPRVLATEQAATTNGKSQKKKAVPTIFYASRTHSQISQVIREYRKTAYRVPMAVLASRKHYCTNARVRSVENLDEECKRLLDNRENGCPHFKNASRVKSHPSLQKGGCHEAHDIEDLVKVGNIVKGCSYFAARSMADDAQLVFCPYGYIINPVIRRAMDVDIKGAVLILDEAHNIEDIAREAGSIDVDEEGLERLQTELGQLCAGDAMTYQPLYEMVQDMLSWMERQKNALEKREFQHYCTCWTGDKAVRELQEASISQQCFPALQECAVKAIKAASDTESGLAHLSGMSAVILEGLFCSLNYFFHGNGAHIHDYQLSLQRFVKKDAVNPAGYWTLTFSLWCLNPAVTFRDIADLSLSVILTSGTLTPTNSFSSELGVQFETCLEAPHVIDVESQVWVSVIPTGPRNYPLNASYKTADGYAFQDALGKSLEEICKVVPGGALVFFPSYKLLDKLYSRWHETGQWSRLNARKPFFVEPRGGNQDDFESVLKGYYDSIRRGHRPTFGRRRKGKKMEANGCSPIDSIDSPNKGAAFLAVCRGKVSEGIDFSDDNARVVIIVGIPFPNINDIQVAQKKKYNDTYKHSKNLLSGSEWYCHQAFRALNQAAGRCIRHRFDYGAIILLDERFREERNVMYISKWLRKSIRQYKNFETSVEELKSFFCNIKERVGTASSLHGSGNTSETMMMPPNDCGKGEGTLRKSQKLRKPLGREEEMNLDNTMAIAGQSDRLPLNVEDDTFIQESSQGNTDVLLASPMNSKDIGCCPGTHQECSFVDLRCSEVPFTATSDEGLELTIVKETPATLGNCLIGSPESISKGENSSSTIVQTSFENPGQGMLYSPSLRNSARSPSELTCSLVVTPERDVSTSNKELILEIESSLNLSVNSHAQKRRKSLNLPLIHLIEEDKFDLEAAKSTQETRATGNSMGNRHANHTNKLGPENMSPRHIINGTNIVQSSAISEDDKSCMSTSPPLDQQLQIFCSRCRNPLGRPENQLYVACSFTVSQKVILSHLLEEKSRTLPQTPSTQVSVLIVDVSSVVFLLSNKSSKDVPHQGIWCQEDGCVYNAVFCPFCPSPNNCLGVQVVATDASNFQLINKILFYYDRLEIRSQQVPESKVLHQDNGTHHIEIVDINSIDKYVYRSPQQSSGGWRTTKTKLRLPKRR